MKFIVIVNTFSGPEIDLVLNLVKVNNVPFIKNEDRGSRKIIQINSLFVITISSKSHRQHALDL